MLPHERYQSKPFIGSSHSWAYSQLERLEKSACVLDIGAGSGVMGAYLKDRGIEQRYAIEIDPATAAHIAPLYSKVETRLESFNGLKFDAILLLDVLEHMADPFTYFSEVAALLNPQGTILVSVPNIAHWSVRIPLLFGVFHYTNRGILDRTHLQFFTRSRFKKLLGSVVGLSLTELNSSIEPVEFVLPEAIWNNTIFRRICDARLFVARYLPGFFAYQHLAALRRN